MDDAEGSVTSYTYKPSFAGAERQFKLTNAGLVWEVGDQCGTWPYAKISAVRLIYWPEMRSWQFRADINGDGSRLVVLSTTWKGFSVKTQDEAYRGFMVALMARALATGAFVGALLLLVFGVVFTWQLDRFIRRNKPCIYTPDALPPQLLP